MAAAREPPRWETLKRIVVKIGSAQVVEPATGRLRATWLNSLADDVKRLTDEGREVILVSSGAIAFGRFSLGLGTGALELEEAQAAAAVGQIGLAAAYADVFQKRGLTAAQVLLTLSDTEERRRYLNARATIQTLLGLKAIPVVNENDTVATSEIRYGDNDRLSARVASMVSADGLVLLSDVDGLYTAPPGSGRNAKRLDVVTQITPEIEAMAGGAASALAKGGMRTKIEAARIAVAAGTHMVITTGQRLYPLSAIREGQPATWFLAGADPVAARKRWIAGQLEVKGSVTIDAGAAGALGKGKSLLPAGVTAVEGAFERGDAVIIRDRQGREIGRGLIAYGTAEAKRIIGRKSGEIAGILGYAGRTELIHRDDCVLAQADPAG